MGATGLAANQRDPQKVLIHRLSVAGFFGVMTPIGHQNPFQLRFKNATGFGPNGRLYCAMGQPRMGTAKGP